MMHVQSSRRRASKIIRILRLISSTWQHSRMSLTLMKYLHNLFDALKVGKHFINASAVKEIGWIIPSPFITKLDFCVCIYGKKSLSNFFFFFSFFPADSACKFSWLPVKMDSLEWRRSANETKGGENELLHEIKCPDNSSLGKEYTESECGSRSYMQTLRGISEAFSEAEKTWTEAALAAKCGLSSAPHYDSSCQWAKRSEFKQILQPSLFHFVL